MTTSNVIIITREVCISQLFKVGGDGLIWWYSNCVVASYACLPFGNSLLMFCPATNSIAYGGGMIELEKLKL